MGGERDLPQASLQEESGREARDGRKAVETRRHRPELFGVSLPLLRRMALGAPHALGPQVGGAAPHAASEPRRGCSSGCRSEDCFILTQASLPEVRSLVAERP